MPIHGERSDESVNAIRCPFRASNEYSRRSLPTSIPCTRAIRSSPNLSSVEGVAMGATDFEVCRTGTAVFGVCAMVAQAAKPARINTATFIAPADFMTHLRAHQLPAPKASSADASFPERHRQLQNTAKLRTIKLRWAVGSS